MAILIQITCDASACLKRVCYHDDKIPVDILPEGWIIDDWQRLFCSLQCQATFPPIADGIKLLPEPLQKRSARLGDFPPRRASAKAKAESFAQKSVSIFCDACETVRVHGFRGSSPEISRNNSSRVRSFLFWYGCEQCGKQRTYGNVEA